MDLVDTCDQTPDSSLLRRIDPWSKNNNQRPYDIR
jgi:hypothetical protein